MLAAAAVLLQFLPYADSGIQFVPLSPWCYVGWESFFVSLVCWAAILGAGFVIIDRSPDSPQAFAILILIAMSLNALLSWSALKEDLPGRSQAVCPQVEASFLPALSGSKRSPSRSRSKYRGRESIHNANGLGEGMRSGSRGGWL